MNRRVVPGKFTWTRGSFQPSEKETTEALAHGGQLVDVLYS